MSVSTILERCFVTIGFGPALAALSCSAAPGEIAADDHDIGIVENALTTSDLTFDVPLRGTGSVSIHAKVYTNPNPGLLAKTVIAVHGFTETANVWEPLANAIFETAPRGRRIKRIVAIDLPGHGASGFPVNLPGGANFGTLLINDYIDVVIESIDALADRGMKPRTIFGHSMGGLIIQGVQEKLLSAGSSLADHGVHGAVLIAPVPALPVTWHQTPVDPSQLAPFIVTNSPNSPFLALPAAIFQAQSFGTLTGTLAPNAPSIAEIQTNGYVGLEPLPVALQLGQGTPPRPSVRQGAFKIVNGTVVSVIGFSQDILVPAADLPPLYDHLTSFSHGLLSFTITAPDAVHSMYVSNPEGMIQALHEML